MSEEAAAPPAEAPAEEKKAEETAAAPADGDAAKKEDGKDGDVNKNVKDQQPGSVCCTII